MGDREADIRTRIINKGVKEYCDFLILDEMLIVLVAYIFSNQSMATQVLLELCQIFVLNVTYQVKPCVCHEFRKMESV